MPAGWTMAGVMGGQLHCNCSGVVAIGDILAASQASRWSSMPTQRIPAMAGQIGARLESLKFDAPTHPLHNIGLSRPSSK